MMKFILTLFVLTTTLSGARAQFEDNYWKKADSEDNFGRASGGTASFYSGSVSGTPAYSNSYILKQDTIIFTDNIGLLCTPAIKGVYRYVITNNVLTYTVISDACFLRAAQINNTQWTKYFPLGISEDMGLEKAVLSPNPVRDIVNIHLPNAKGVFQLFDVKSNLVLKVELYQVQSAVSLSHLPSGIYNAQIISGSGSVNTTRIIVE